MRRITVLISLSGLVAGLIAAAMILPEAHAEGEGPGAAPRKKPAPIPGIRWERDFEKGLARAARLGRPVFIAVNALENEAANNRLAGQLYRSPAWGEASRGYIAFVCNPNTHGAGAGPTCSRYPGCDCATHRKALDWFLEQYGQDLISPQHVILEPDGDVAYRKQYYTGVVGPSLLENYLSNLDPKAAYARAAGTREKQIRELASCPPEEIGGRAAQWLDGRDGLAAAALVNVLDDAYDESRRTAVIRALSQTPGLQVPVLLLAAEERILFPQDEPAETRLWLETLFAADRRMGIWGATRALVRMDRAADRDAVLRIWAGRTPTAAAPGIDDLPKGERAAAFEALILAGDRRAQAGKTSASWTAGRAREIARARAKTGTRSAASRKLAEALETPNPRVLRPLILDAQVAEIRANEEGLAALLAQAPWQRVRIAAALRLLEIRKAVGGAVAGTLVPAISDPIEGPDARLRAVRILGADPGQSTAEWTRALKSFVSGGAK